jgi:flagellin-specific chaperone FliS
MGKFKAVIEVEVISEKNDYLKKKQELFDGLMQALQKLYDFKNPG